MRSIMNPTFSSFKLRSLTPLINMCVKRLMETLDKTSEKEISCSQLVSIDFPIVNKLN